MSMFPVRSRSVLWEVLFVVMLCVTFFVFLILLLVCAVSDFSSAEFTAVYIFISPCIATSILLYHVAYRRLQVTIYPDRLLLAFQPQFLLPSKQNEICFEDIIAFKIKSGYRNRDYCVITTKKGQSFILYQFFPVYTRMEDYSVTLFLASFATAFKIFNENRPNPVIIYYKNAPMYYSGGDWSGFIDILSAFAQ